MKYIDKIIKLEKKRQKMSVNLIASENYLSCDYSKIDTGILMSKYAEGYVKKRYYAGCKYVDMIEKYTINVCKKLFKVKYVNVQPHSGSQANQAVYMSFCELNDKVLGLNLKDGGHLTHGSNVNYSGKNYSCYKYTLNKNFYINYDEINNIVFKIKPKLLIAGASSFSRIINWCVIKKIINKHNVILLADISHIAGLVATDIYPSPIKIADVISLTLQKTLRGPRGAVLLTNSKDFIELIDKAVFPGVQGGPFINIIALKAICFKKAMKLSFKNYQKKVIKNSKLLALLLKNNGFEIISYGTDTHLFLLSLKNLNITGLEAEKLLEKANIITNKNFLPNDSKISSGVRFGTSAITTRGFSEYEIKLISDWITDILRDKKSPIKIKEYVINMCKNFPIYKDE